MELYHPSKKFDINLPDLPSDLFVQELSGLWIDGKLLFCGMKMVKWYLTCYELMKNQGRNTGHGPLGCTVCWEKFEYNCKYFQRDLHNVKENVSELQHISCMKIYV